MEVSTFMLSESQEKFIKRFEAALVEKGKHPEFIAQQVASVTQQFEYGNQQGKPVDVLGGGPENYANVVGRDLPRAHQLFRPIITVFILIFGVMTIPQLLNGTFAWTLEYILFVLLFPVVGAYGLYIILKISEKRFVEYNKNKISMIAYLILFTYIIILVGVGIFGTETLRGASLVNIGTPSTDTMFIIGWVVLALVVITFLVMRYWLFSIVVIIFSVAPLISRQFTAVPMDDDGYLILTNIVLMLTILLVVVVIGVVVFIYSKRRK